MCKKENKNITTLLPCQEIHLTAIKRQDRPPDAIFINQEARPQ
jgi:hypothetical protein